MQVLLIVALVVAAAVIDGLALSVLWGWFVHPLGVREIGIAHAIGISIVLRFILSDTAKTKQGKGTWELVGTLLLAPLFAIAMGWVIHLFM